MYRVSESSFRSIFCAFCIVWLGLIAPCLMQIERACDALAHAAAQQYIGSTASSDAPHDGPLFDHCKAGHCHSPLAHDQLNGVLGLRAIHLGHRNAFNVTGPADFRSFIAPLPVRPPRV